MMIKYICIFIIYFIGTMNNQSRQLSQSLVQIQGVLLGKFSLYVKKTAHFYSQLQNYKRQLASYLNSINYTLPFSVLDIDRKNKITQQNIQHFLIQHKYLAKPCDINAYFIKYSHGKSILLYQDILQCLVPHSDYILLTSTAKTINQTLLQRAQTKYLYKRKDKQIIRDMVALIVSTQISFMKSSFIMINDITNDSLKTGPILWRVLDRTHQNHVNYQKMREIIKQNGIQISYEQWKAFINWHFRTIKTQLTRGDFMYIFYELIETKKNKFASNSQYFSRKQLQKKVNQSLRESVIKNQQITMKKSHLAVSRMSNLQKSHLTQSTLLKSRSYSAKNLRHTRVPSQMPQQIIDPSNLAVKRLLYTKIGYKNPQHLIKLSEFS